MRAIQRPQRPLNSSLLPMKRTRRAQRDRDEERVQLRRVVGGQDEAALGDVLAAGDPHAREQHQQRREHDEDEALEPRPLRAGAAVVALEHAQPRPTYGIFVAITVMNCTLASSGSEAMWATARPTLRDVHRRLGLQRPVGLRHAAGHPLGHLGGGVADVDLPAGDVELAPFQRQRLGDPRDRVLGRVVGDRVRPRDVGRERAVVDDAPAPRLLRGHRAERRLRAQEGAGDVGVHHPLPVLEGQLGDRRGHAEAGVVEQQVHAPVALAAPRRTARATDAGSVTSVGTARPSPSLRDSLRGASRRPAATTLHPSLSRAFVAARPIPEPAPVTTAIMVAKGKGSDPRKRHHPPDVAGPSQGEH